MGKLKCAEQNPEIANRPLQQQKKLCGTERFANRCTFPINEPISAKRLDNSIPADAVGSARDLNRSH